MPSSGTTARSSGRSRGGPSRARRRGVASGPCQHGPLLRWDCGRDLRCCSFEGCGAGGNRTLVRRAVIARATTIPETSALRLPTCRVRWIRGSHRRVFPRCQWSFSPSAVCPCCLHRFCCRAAVDRPRAPSLVTMTLHSPDQIRRRERTAHRRFFVVPRLTSLSNSGRTQRLPVPPSKPISPWCCPQCTAPP